MQYISTSSFGDCIAASTLCIFNVVSRHIIYLIKYIVAITLYFSVMSNKVLAYHSGAFPKLVPYLRYAATKEGFQLEKNII